MNLQSFHHSCRHPAGLILAGFIAALLVPRLSAQTTITYTHGQTDTTAYSVAAPNNPTTLTIDSGAAIQSGPLSGAGRIIKTGNGTLTLTNGNNYTGGTTLSAGTLLVSNDFALGAGPLTIEGGTFGSTVNNISVYNDLSVQGDFDVVTAASAGSLYLRGNVDLNGGTRVITGTTDMGIPQFLGVISNGGVTFRSTFTTPGNYVAFVLNNSAPNTYTGLTTVRDYAYLVFLGTATNGAIVGDILVENGGVLDLLGVSDQIADTSTVTVNSTGNSASGTIFQGMELYNNNETIGTLFGTGTVGTGSGTLTVGSGSFSGTIGDGMLGSGGKLIKNTAGTLILEGTNTHTGTTTVNDGELTITGSIATSILTLINGGTLSGTGTVGALTLQSGVLAPGTSAGVLDSGNILFSGGIFAVEIASAVLADQMDVTGTAGLGANTELSLALLGGYDPQGAESWVLVNNDGLDAFTTGAFRFTVGGIPIEDNTPFTVGGENYVLQYNGGTGNDVVLTAAVPEPATAMLLLAGWPLLARRRRG